MELLLGLPIRTVNFTNKDGVQVEVSVSTEAVDTLLSTFIDENQGRAEFADDIEAFEHFDGKVGYFVPDGVFLGSQEELLDFLHAMDGELGIE